MTPRAELETHTSFDYLERHARATPGRIAITGPGRDISWARFHADAGRFALALQELGLAPGQTAAISHPDRYVQWLLGIACESIGVTFGCFAADDPAGDSGLLLARADRVLTETDQLGEKWIAGVFAREPADHRRHPVGLDAPLRIIRTSGSTGTPKCLFFTRRMLAYWVESMTACSFRSPAVRYYPAYPLTVNPAYNRMEICLRIGATVILGSVSQDLVTHRATHCWLLPRDALSLLRGVREKWPSAQPLNLILGGAPVPAALHDRAAQLLGTPVTILYATNETGLIGLMDRDGNGRASRDVDLKIVDDAGESLPPGVAGTIAVRTPGMAAGYPDLPEATAGAFRGGWFITGDLGVRLPDGRFRILGRRGDILNLGGLKVSPGPIEEQLCAAVPGLREVAVTSLPDEQGVEELCVAVVPEGRFDQAALTRAVGAALDPTLGRFWLLPLEKLPVGAAGKLRRDILKQMFAAARARP